MSRSQRRPEWIRLGNGQVIPFDADLISRGLFAAGKRLGNPDSFTARELTESVLHFLSEASESVLSVEQVDDVVVKVVRELGYPELAWTYASFYRLGCQARVADTTLPADVPLPRIESAAHSDFSLREVFSPDLVALHQEGLLRLGGLDAPFHLAGVVVSPAQDFFQSIVNCRRFADKFVVLDSPEFWLADDACTSVEPFIKDLHCAVQATGLQVIVNLNIRESPAWASDLVSGPLFASAFDQEARRTEIALRLFRHLPKIVTIRTSWHLQVESFQPQNKWVLDAILEGHIQGKRVVFSFDRPKQPVSLSRTLDRRRTALLLCVSLDLARFARRRGMREPERFLEKLGTLARLAVSAGAQKREFLRRRQNDWPAFLLDRAHLVVRPLHLDRAVHHLSGKELCGDEEALEFAEQIVRRLRDVLAAEAASRHIGVRLDGVSPHDDRPAMLQQLRAVAYLHRSGPTGTATICYPSSNPPDRASLFDVLALAQADTTIESIEFLGIGSAEEPTSKSSETDT
ncbi:MAG: hypothetical protein KatS3mg105_1446 [Gemmatales bacterium]|nr:MAG: hypothetical protein KatS3mg105_1446 [Gemmatales bacterium]